jgi:integrase
MAKNPHPKLRFNSKGYAFVEIDKRRHYLGFKRGDRRADVARERLLLMHGYGAEAVTTIDDLCALFLDWGAGYYRKRNATTSEYAAFLRVAALLRGWFGDLPAQDFTPRHFEAIRDALIDGRMPTGLSKRRRSMTRESINAYMALIVRIFRRGGAKGWVDESVYTALRTVEGLKAGRCAARETADVRPVPEEMLRSVLNHLDGAEAADMIRFQLLTAARPGEVVHMTRGDIDMSRDDVWYYHVPDEYNKTAHHGATEPIAITLPAQDIIRRRVARAADACIFDRYCTRDSYRTAIYRACDHVAADPPEDLRRIMVIDGRSIRKDRKNPPRLRLETLIEHRTRLGVMLWDEYLDWRRAHRFHPHQLRHNAITAAHRQGGVELARRVARHKSIKTDLSPSN